MIVVIFYFLLSKGQAYGELARFSRFTYFLTFFLPISQKTTFDARDFFSFQQRPPLKTAVRRCHR